VRPFHRAAWLTGAALLMAAAQGGAEPPAVATTRTPRVHVVVDGDTLSGIAARYKVTVAALAAANQLGERAVLKVGKRLVIPAATTISPTPDHQRVMASTSRPTAAPPRAGPGPRGAPARRPGPGAQGLELAVPDFVETSPAFAWPVEGPISSLFGRRRNAWHRGIDIKADPGTVVLASAAGVVVTSGTEPRYGRVVKIEHDDGYVTVYAHNEENLVEPGARVAAGDPIATIGRSGRATAHHLHFEIRRNGGVYNPLYLLPLPPRVARVEESGEPEEEHE
jgi:murein DD-endopeptidase MepM/ murein hydrolase activator NlpD